jgi:hypothetical protein
MTMREHFIANSLDLVTSWNIADLVICYDDVCTKSVQNRLMVGAAFIKKYSSYRTNKKNP